MNKISNVRRLTKIKAYKDEHNEEGSDEGAPGDPDVEEPVVFAGDDVPQKADAPPASSLSSLARVFALSDTPHQREQQVVVAENVLQQEHVQSVEVVWREARHPHDAPGWIDGHRGTG